MSNRYRNDVTKASFINAVFWNVATTYRTQCIQGNESKRLWQGVPQAYLNWRQHHAHTHTQGKELAQISPHVAIELVLPTNT